jgi:hypothetical protein
VIRPTDRPEEPELLSRQERSAGREIRRKLTGESLLKESDSHLHMTANLATPHVQFLRISTLLKGRPVRHSSKVLLERMLISQFGVDKAKPFFHPDVNLATYQSQRYGAISNLMSNIKANTRKLRASGLDALVIDTISGLKREQKDMFIASVTSIWLSGIEVILIDSDNKLISFNEIGEVVCSNQFIKIYIDSLWEEEICHRKTERSTQRLAVLN